MTTIPPLITDHGPRRYGSTENGYYGLRVSVSPWLVAVCVAVMMVTNAEAQSGFMLRGFADAGTTTFTAQQSFQAILGSKSGPVFGGGVEAVERNVFLNARASRFRKTGERVFIFGGEEFDLGIPATVTVTPIELTAGYRFDFGSWIVPYAGGGMGWHKYTETSEFAEDSENVKETFQGYHVLGGAEFRFGRWLGAAAEAQWTTVPDALGSDDNGVSKAFEETDLGGTTLRVKIIVGR